MAGNVIGIDSAGNVSAQNIGFAIAIDAAQPIIDQAIAHPKAPEAYLGVTSEGVDAGLAAQLGLPIDHGVLVLALAPGGPAAKAGISAGDVIVSFDGRSVDTSDELGNDILRHAPGDVVKVNLVNPSGAHRTVTVTLGVRPLP
jgi:serine protease Do